jgi:hypothetical protein
MITSIVYPFTSSLPRPSSLDEARRRDEAADSTDSAGRRGHEHRLPCLVPPRSTKPGRETMRHRKPFLSFQIKEVAYLLFFAYNLHPSAVLFVFNDLEVIKRNEMPLPHFRIAKHELYSIGEHKHSYRNDFVDRQLSIPMIS